VSAVGGHIAENETWEDMDRLQLSLETICARFETDFALACYDLSHGSYHVGFKSISRLCNLIKSASTSGSTPQQQQDHALFITLLNDTRHSFKK
jgi:hypothetical protein